MTEDQLCVLEACQALCRVLAQEALTRIAVSLDPTSKDEHQTWLLAQRREIEQWLDQLEAAL